MRGGVNAQSAPDWFFWVYPNHADAYPTTTAVNATSNSAVLNSLFTTYGMKRYHEAFPGAPAGSILQNAYTLAFDGDMEAFYQDLDATGLFDAIYLWGGDEAITLSETSSTSLVSDPNVTCATPLSYKDPYPAFPDGEPNYDSDWNIDDTDADCAWTITQGDPNIIIGYVDTEFYDEHPELIGKKLPDVEMSPGAEAFTINEGCMHGTATMGDAVAIPNNGQFIAGMGYNTKAAGYIVETRASGDGCSAVSNSDLWAGLWRAGHTDNRPIVNISWTGIGKSANSPAEAPPFGTLIAHEAVSIIINTGTLIVAAAGRRFVVDGVVMESFNHDDFGNIPGYLIVGGVNIDKRHAPTNSPSYPEIDMCAPSTRVNSVSYDTLFNLTVRAARGDSHAAPFVAGAAALCLSANPCLEPQDLEYLLKNTVDPIDDAHDYPGLVGTGYLNVYKAVLAASEKITATTITGQESCPPRRVDGYITIAAGAELQINSNVSFSQLSRLVVEPGGRLIINKAHLKPDCDNAANTWSGIEVKGDPNASQFSLSSQGFVWLDSAIIEGAHIGVSLIERNTYTLGGGVLFADDSQFVNCFRGVQIAKYENFFPGGSTPTANLSHITNCDFTVNDDYSFNNGGEHIHLDRVTRVNITDCLLTDERSNYADADELHNGIWSTNATYVVKDADISHLRYGIKAENIKSGRTFQLRDNTFAQNFMGLSVRAVDNFEVSNNVFTVGNFDGPTTEFEHPNRPTGIHVDQSSGFFIEDNQFDAAPSLLSNTEPVGVAVNNTNVGIAGDLTSETNSLFRNSFNGLYRANVANGINSDPHPVTGGGLRYFCNQNTANICTDFTVYDGTIAPVQRTLDNKAAGNTFTQDDSCNPFSDFDNTEGNFITYHYYDQSAGNVQEPIYVNLTNLSKVEAIINECTNNDGSPGPLPGGGDGNLVADFPTLQQNYQTFRQQYYSLLDGGDTDALLNDLATLTQGGRAAMWQQLNQTTPYLSAAVLLAVTEHSLFTVNHKKNLLMDNPESLKDASLKSSVETGGWFNTQQLAAIKAAEQNTTARTTLENDLRAALAELQGLTQALENYYQLDEADAGLDYATQATWAANGSSLDGYLRSIDNRLWAGDVTAVNNEIASLQAMDMSTAQNQEISRFVQLKNLEKTLLNSNRSYDELTSGEINTLQTIATQSSSRAGIQAQNWLHLLDISEAQKEAYWYAGGPGGSSLTAGEENTTSAEVVAYLQVQPNPSKEVFQFQLADDKMLVNAMLRIYNLQGQLQYQQPFGENHQLIWQPNTSQAGLYFFVLQDEQGKLLQQGKLIYLQH